MKFALISPRLAIQKGDFLGSGVPYWPLELATLATFIRQDGDSVVFIDLFGAAPAKLTDNGDHYLQGEPLDSSQWREDLGQAEAFVLYAISYMSHQELLTSTRWLRQQFPAIRIAILENAQAVTAYSLSSTASAFLDAGADFLICGEPYFNWSAIKQHLASTAASLPDTPNVISRNSVSAPVRHTEKMERYPVPAWDQVNLDNYWNLPYSHGPKTRKFLPILTSRGCPYPCDFCVVPETNNRRWRGNSPEHVVDEIIELRDRYGVHDFQVEDVNPTVQHKRWERICQLLIERRAGIRFYFVSGTKAETIHLEQVALFARAGCRYISISPESGSSALMKTIGKKFDQQHGLNLISECRKYGIKTQACFLVGHPNESHEDFLATKRYLSQIVRAGADEVAVFVVSAFAGSSLFARNSISMNNRAALPSFSPRGRRDYEMLELRRKELVRTFFIEKLFKGTDLWIQGFRAIIGKPQTKMENLPRRVMYIIWLLLKNRLIEHA